MTHICPFCDVELSHDYENSIDHYRCDNHVCMLGTFNRCEFSYLNQELTYRSLIFTIGNDNYRIDCSYAFGVTWIEKIDRVLKFALPGTNHYLPVTVIKIDKFIFEPDASLEEVAKIIKRCLNLRVFL